MEGLGRDSKPIVVVVGLGTLTNRVVRMIENVNTHKEALITRQYHYAILFEPAEEGGYTVTCPALPGLVTEGDTREEARAMVVDAIRCYLKSLEKDGIPPPVEAELEALPIREKVTVQLTEG